MSLPPEYIGTFKFSSQIDSFLRTYHVWVSYDPLLREVESIYISNSSIIAYASGPLLRQDCHLPYQKSAWAFAVERCTDDVLIEPYPEQESDTVLYPTVWHND